MLYGPQVILNHWVTEWSLSPHAASALVYATLIPMSVAPLSYGALLGAIETRRVTIGALLGLTLSTALLAFSSTYTLTLLCRLTQGALLPAVMTSVMSRLSAAGATQGPRLITYYLTATVLGGLLGRLVTGHLAERWSLGWVWCLWATLLALHALALTLTRGAPIPFNVKPITKHEVLSALRLPSARECLWGGALMFGAFAAALNLLPLRAAELNVVGGSAAVADRYWGYLVGAWVSLNARHLDARLGGRGRAAALGMIVMALALGWGGLSLEWRPLFGMVLGLCLGLFITHPLLAARITQLNPSQRGLMSGLYVSSYYIGGALSSAVSSLLFAYCGWEVTLSALIALALGGSLVVRRALRPLE